MLNQTSLRAAIYALAAFGFLFCPRPSSAESHISAGTSGTALRASARLDFKIIIPRVLALDVAQNPGQEETVEVCSNSRSVALTSSSRETAGVRGNLVVNSAARRTIHQRTVCSTLGGAGARSLVCTASMP